MNAIPFNELMELDEDALDSRIEVLLQEVKENDEEYKHHSAEISNNAVQIMVFNWEVKDLEKELREAKDEKDAKKISHDLEIAKARKELASSRLNKEGSQTTQRFWQLKKEMLKRANAPNNLLEETEEEISNCKEELRVNKSELSEHRRRLQQLLSTQEKKEAASNASPTAESVKHSSTNLQSNDTTALSTTDPTAGHLTSPTCGESTNTASSLPTAASAGCSNSLSTSYRPQVSSMTAEDIHDVSKPNFSNLTLIKWKNEAGETKKFRLKNSIVHKWRDIGNLVLPRQQLEAWARKKDEKECCEAVLSHWLDQSSRRYPATWEGLYELLDDSELSQAAIELRQAVDNAI